ncbi:uncharacterized protein METZ01_LOCUS486883, partial [marine metagenome]
MDFVFKVGLFDGDKSWKPKIPAYFLSLQLRSNGAILLQVGRDLIRFGLHLLPIVLPTIK